MKVPVRSVGPSPLRSLLTTSDPKSCWTEGVEKKVVFYRVVYGDEVTLNRTSASLNYLSLSSLLILLHDDQGMWSQPPASS